MQIEKLDFNNKIHRLFAEYIIQKNAKYFLNDYISAGGLLTLLRDVIKHKFIFFTEKQPYGRLRVVQFWTPTFFQNLSFYG
jgi:hypothetical protein